MMKAAYIGRIYIENFHAFKGKNEIPIIKDDGTLQQWTVIVGENNSGKTSLLKAVASLEPFIEYKVKSEYYLPLGFVITEPFNLKADISLGCDVWWSNMPSMFIGKIKLKKFSKYLSERYSYQWGYTTHFDKETGTHSGLCTNRNHDEFKNFRIYGYGVSRKIGNNNASDDEKLFGENSLTLIYNGKDITDLTDWLFQLNFASKNSEDKAVQTKATDRITHIKNLIISEIFPDIFDLRFTTTDDLKNHLEFQTKDGWFQLHELGYGYQTTLAWIFDLSKKMMERYPASKQPLREPAVVLIDEIDLHLHPAWQRRIINYLSDNFTATQFIVTTHSPHVLQELKEVNLVQLKRENGATKIICRPNSSFQGWTIEEILNDVLETPSTHSTRYEGLMQKFDKALDNEDYKTAHETYEILSKMLHPNSPDRKILEIQLSQLPA